MGWEAKKTNRPHLLVPIKPQTYLASSALKREKGQPEARWGAQPGREAGGWRQLRGEGFAQAHPRPRGPPFLPTAGLSLWEEVIRP